MPVWALPAFSWLVSFYFLLAFAANVGFPPVRHLFTGDFVYVALWLFFLFLPFYKKIKVGNFLELEREVEKVREETAKAKEELTSFKSEVRSTLQVLSTNVNTIGGMSNQVNVTFPGFEVLQGYREFLESKADPGAQVKANEVENKFLRQSETDKSLALVKMRIEIERLLRRGLGKRLKVSQPGLDPIKFMPVSKLFQMFLREYPDFNYLGGAFRTAIAAGNSAAHAQHIPDNQADEALALGSQIIAILEELFPEVDEE